MSSRRVKICKPTGGVVDLALVVDMDAVRSRRRAERSDRKGRKHVAVKAPVADPLHASADERRMHASLKADWTLAQPGEDKRRALASLRSWERRHGMDAWTPSVRDRSDAVAVSSERWG